MRNYDMHVGICFIVLIMTTFRCLVHVSILKCQPHKMVKHTQTIRRLLPTNCLSVFDHFVGLALKELKIKGKK